MEDAESQDTESQAAGGQGEIQMPAGLGLGRIVIYRSKTGSYDLPAVVTATVDTLDPKGVELGHVPALSGPAHVHLTVFTCGKQGTARVDNKVNNEAAGGTYQEFNIPNEFLGDEKAGDSEPSPGTWRWPVRKPVIT